MVYILGENLLESQGKRRLKMRIPLSWLKDYLKFDLSNEALENELTLAGLEVDKVECSSFSFQGVITCQIEKVSPHPHADKLQIATVSDGKESFQVVCGAPNCKAGMKTAFAKIGATLETDSGKTLKIKKN